MVKYKYIDWICIGAAVLAILLTLLLMFGEQLGLPKASANPGYVTRLFDDSRVHVIDIQIADWGVFIEDAEQEEYVACTVEIDGEAFHNIGLRAKGNNSLRLTEEYGLSRYSLKLEFDQFLDGGNYYGLDKFSLDASFQDNSYLKTYMVYDMMAFMGIPTPLCSYTWVTVNGEDWGLFLAIEEPEESFARRNFGNDYGKLYKPDYRSLNAENADVALQYIDDRPDSYPGLFENAKFKVSEADQKRMIEALKTLSTGENLETAVNVDEVLRYFTVQVFVMNWDSYLGHTGHNYFLYEENGILSILPWDYNLAFGTFSGGGSGDAASSAVNYPIDTPVSGTTLEDRPLLGQLLANETYLDQYHAIFDEFISGYFESGHFEQVLEQAVSLISPYVEQDPSAFYSYEEFQTGVEALRTFCQLRAQSVRGQLD